MKSYVYAFSALLLTFGSGLHANCGQAVRKVVLENMGLEARYLIGDEFLDFYSVRDQRFSNLVDSLGTKETILSNKGESQKVLRLLAQKKSPENLRAELEVIYDSINDPALLKEWIRDLHASTLFDIYVNGSPEVRANFESTKRIPEDALINTLNRRVRRGGFQANNIERISEGLSSEAFGELLKQRKLLIDTSFKGGSHGHFIHFVQVDLMIFSLLKANKDPSVAGEIYQWMGEAHKIELDNREVFSSLRDGWDSFFDSFEGDPTHPERFNPMIESYLGWRI